MARIESPDAPNFFIIGAAKCGTTTLYNLLKQHPDIYMPDDKEPRFFNVDDHYAKGVDYYLNQYFKDAGKFPARGEASPPYLPNGDTAAPRIKEAFGADIKFIVILRDPVQRAWSHYQHLVRWGAEKEDFDTALSLENSRIEKGNLSWRGYFNDGLYASQLKKWFNYFPRNNFLILLTEDLKTKPIDTVKEIFGFLSVDVNVHIDTKHHSNTASTAKHKWLGTLFNRPNKITNIIKHIFPYTLRKTIRDKFNDWNKQKMTHRTFMDKKTAEKLCAKYCEDVMNLEEILQRDLHHWRNSVED